MSTGASDAAESASDLRARVVSTLKEQFPQLRNSERAVTGVDSETGVVTLSFGCGCSGGLSEPAKQAIENQLVNDVDGITGMRTESGCGCGSGGGHGHGHGHDHGAKDSDDGPEAPF